MEQKEPKSLVIAIRVTKHERDTLYKIARTLGVKPAEAIRKALLGAGLIPAKEAK